MKKISTVYKSRINDAYEKGFPMTTISSTIRNKMGNKVFMSPINLEYFKTLKWHIYITNSNLTIVKAWGICYFQ